MRPSDVDLGEWIEDLGEWIDAVNTHGVNLTPWEVSFMESLTDQWERTGWVSDRQRETLERIYTERVP